MPSSRFRRFLMGIVITAVSTALCLVVLELLLHVAFTGRFTIALLTPHRGLMQPDPVRGWTPRPNVELFIHTVDYAVTARTNSRGLYDTEHAYEKNDGVFRIVVLGDSFFSTEYVNLEETMPFLLEQALGPRVEVINLSATGYGTAQEYLYLRDEGLRYNPDLVLLEFFPQNDLRNNHQPLETRVWGEDEFTAFGRPYARLAHGSIEFQYPDVRRIEEDMAAQRAKRIAEIAATPWFERTMTWTLVRDVTAGAGLTGQRWASYDPLARYGPYIATMQDSNGIPYTQWWTEAWEITAALIEATHELAQSSNARFAVFTVPAKIQVDESERAAFRERHPSLDLDVMKYQNKVLALAADKGFILLDLLPDLEAAHKHGSCYFRRDAHWNVRGHRVAAQALTRLLRQQELVPLTPGPAPSGRGGN